MEAALPLRGRKIKFAHFDVKVSAIANDDGEVRLVQRQKKYQTVTKIEDSTIR